MRVALLASEQSIHTQQWVYRLAEAGIEVHLITLSNHTLSHATASKEYRHVLHWRSPVGYFLGAVQLTHILKAIKPDILHAHYATGYGTLGRLTNFHPYLVSVWGSDVYEFPDRSPIHRWWLRGSLHKADVVASTSNVMARRTAAIGPAIKKLVITPFGVDVASFSPAKNGDTRSTITFGIAKKLEHIYGIDTLIRAFATLKFHLTDAKSDLAGRLRLSIAGDGGNRSKYQKLAVDLKVSDVTTFHGFISHSQMNNFLRGLDVFVNPSRAESYGVAVIEACSTGLPVIVTDVGGLPEVVLQDKTGLVVPTDSVLDLAKAMYSLAINPDLRRSLGNSGQAHVQANYSWERCVQIMMNAYSIVVSDPT